MKILVITLFLFFHSNFANTQIHWDFSAKKTGDKTYELYLTPTIKTPWHIYSQTSPEDGAFPTSFIFNKNPLAIIDGQPKEVGKLVTKYEDVFDTEVKYFEGKVDFVQVVKLKANVKTTVTGSVEYMVCKEGMCLPPQKVQFSVRLE